MKNVELDLEPAEYLSEFDESETGYEEDSEAFDDIPTSDVELEPGEEVRRFPRPALHRPLRSRSGFASRLLRRHPLRPRFPGRLRPRPPRPPWNVRPGFRRRISTGHDGPCICPAHGTEYVRWVQSSLNQVTGLNLPVNGVMNPATREALRRFQQQQGLDRTVSRGPTPSARYSM